MLLLVFTSCLPSPQKGPFQYNLCYCQSEAKVSADDVRPNFNTTYVTVSRILVSARESVIGSSNFNTTYVTVSPLPGQIVTPFSFISIQLMLLLVCQSSSRITKRTRISIQLMLLLVLIVGADVAAVIFQYNLCYCQSVFQQV